MSGPKSSRYALTPEQRKALEEQRKLEQRRAVARETVKQASKALSEIGSRLPETEKLAALAGNHPLAQKQKELEGCIAAVTAALAACGTEDADALEATAATVTETRKKAEALAAEVFRLAAETEAQVKASLADEIDRGFATSFEEINPRGIAATKRQLRQQLLELQADPQLPPALLPRLEAALSQLETMDSEAFLKNFASVTVTPLLKECRDTLSEQAACREEYEVLSAEYLALCELYCYVPQQYPCCAASVETLRAEIARITRAVAEDDEQAYISDCLDQVMAEMGYTVLGTRQVAKKSGRRFRSELYTYGEGTAVNVTYSSDGKIAMELGGLDTTDRLPDARETAALVGSMERFCSDFPEIERRLAAKGVVLAQRISMLPVSPAYAQIINTADYQMTENAEKHQTKKKRPTRRQSLRRR